MVERYESRKIVDKYVSDVLSGKRVAGKYQAYAVKRYIHDCKTANERGLVFDADAAHYACNLSQIWKHTEGSQFDKKPVILEPWQAFCMWNIFGWKHKETNLRRYRRAYINVAAKSGKTTWMATVALLLGIADMPVEAGAQVYVVATTLNQSRILYDQAVKFVEGNDYVRDIADIYRGQCRIQWEPSGAIVRPIVVGPNIDGINAHAVIRDELHAFRESHRDGCGKIPSRMAARQQPLMIDITTAGSDASLLWEEEHRIAVSIAESVVSGVAMDDSYFPFICTIDEGDDPFDESVWIKANPSLGVTVGYDYYRAAANRAKQLPTALSEFLRYQCNVKSSATSRAIMPEHWAMGNEPIQHPLWQEGRGGVDLSRTRDFTAISAVFPVRDESEKIIRWEVLSKSWVCSHGRLRLDREPFRTWIYEGKLAVIEGDRILYDEIEEEIVRWSEVYNVVQWAFDPNRAAELMNRLQQRGIEVFPFNQSVGKYNEACERFQDECMAGNIRHGNDPVLTWQIGNMEYITRENGLSMPNKKNVASKIDAACATLMAFQGCMFAERQAASFYDNNGLEMF